MVFHLKAFKIRKDQPHELWHANKIKKVPSERLKDRKVDEEAPFLKPPHSEPRQFLMKIQISSSKPTQKYIARNSTK